MTPAFISFSCVCVIVFFLAVRLVRWLAFPRAVYSVAPLTTLVATAVAAAALSSPAWIIIAIMWRWE